MAIIQGFAGVRPRIAPDVFIAENATIVGDVEIGPGASIWYGAVLRGDCGRIVIGARTNIQDLAVIHMTGGVSHSAVGADVTVGHGVIVHGADVADGALVGMGAILLDNCRIGAEALVAAGSVVPPRMVVPPGVMVRGSPARVIRALSDGERAEGRKGADIYCELARGHARP